MTSKEITKFWDILEKSEENKRGFNSNTFLGEFLIGLISEEEREEIEEIKKDGEQIIFFVHGSVAWIKIKKKNGKLLVSAHHVFE